MNQDGRLSFTNEIIEIRSNARGSNLMKFFEMRFEYTNHLLSKTFYYAFDSSHPKVKLAQS